MHTSRTELNDQTWNDRISIVMITHNRGEQIRSALAHLLQLPEKPRIIVVDNGSTDGTVEVVRAMGGAVEVMALEENLSCAGRNIGVEKAETPYVAFSDDDSWWAPGALQQAADLFDANPKLGLIAAQILIGPNEQIDPLCQVMASTPLEDSGEIRNVGIPIVGFAACGAIVRRQAFLEAGGFERRLGVGGEEHILALDLLRNGWSLAYVDRIIAHHHPSPIRNPARRKRVELRNAFWSVWLRRPTPTALAETRRMLKLSLRDKAYRAGFIEGVLGLPWVLSARNPIPVAIDRQVKIAEAVFYGS